mmetsp:Transcript_20672/g.18820  ORF Transcript_20672/g.18820 Transcript_20672/m.18820 type:complete len:378 (-) Transcript_20672:428-1561(-)
MSAGNTTRYIQDHPVNLFADHELQSTEGTIEYCLENPLYCGFLLKFCETEYNVENIRFIMAVDSFRDTVLARDRHTWHIHWKELDQKYLKPLDSKLEEEILSQPWISPFDVKEFDRLIKNIWEDYLIDTARMQICMPGKVLENTSIRLKFKYIYGPDVFVEACIDPVKTIRRDILPRFVQSSIYKSFEELNKVDSTLLTLNNETLAMLLPDNNRFTKNKNIIASLPNDYKFELHEVLDTGILFYEFLVYLRQSVCSENLLCVRMINIFEDLYDLNQINEAIKQAWRIYKTFIEADSTYEISLNHLCRKEIALKMAFPNQIMFETAKKSAYQALRNKFLTYQSSKQYDNLINVLKSKVEELSSNSSKTNANPFACFGK